MRSRVARRAGNIPPSNPITSAIRTPRNSTVGPNRNEKVISLNVAQVAVPVESPLNGSVARQPSKPPSRQMMTDSNTNEE